MIHHYAVCVWVGECGGILTDRFLWNCVAKTLYTTRWCWLYSLFWRPPEMPDGSFKMVPYVYSVEKSVRKKLTSALFPYLLEDIIVDCFWDTSDLLVFMRLYPAILGSTTAQELVPTTPDIIHIEWDAGAFRDCTSCAADNKFRLL